MRLTSKIWGHLSKQPPKTLLCYGLGFLSALIFLLLVNPLDAAQRFKFALDDIFKDFKLDISVDITKCGVFLWTRENRYQPDKFKILDKETLIGTHFNKYVSQKHRDMSMNCRPGKTNAFIKYSSA